MVWGSTWATEAVGFVNGLAWPGLAGRLLQTLISITLQNLSWTSSFCHHRIALSSPILIGSFQHYTSSSLSSQTLTDFMNLILSWLPALGHYKCNSLSTQALTGSTNWVLSSLPSSDIWALEDPLQARGKPSTYVSAGRARRTCQFNYKLNTFIAAQLSNTTNVEVLSSKTLTSIMNLILSWLPAHRHYKCSSLSSRALTRTTNIILSSLPNSQTLRM